MINFQRWTSSHGRWFVRYRILLKGYIWTPFCTVWPRYWTTNTVDF